MYGPSTYSHADPLLLEKYRRRRYRHNPSRDSTMKPDLTSVLCMSEVQPSRQKVKRHYLSWRIEQGIPARCDSRLCQFFSAPLLWNDEPLPLILDHTSGNACDNRPENLRLLCPNCDSLNAHTRGGANAGRVKRLPLGSYEVRSREGTHDAFVSGAALGVQATARAGPIAPTTSQPDKPLSDA
jgi:hypothetical protein